MTPEDHNQLFANLPVFPVSTPAIHHGPRERLEAVLERLAAPIWSVIYRLAGK